MQENLEFRLNAQDVKLSVHFLTKAFKMYVNVFMCGYVCDHANICL